MYIYIKMDYEQIINNMFFILSILNINVIYYISNNSELLNIVYNNSKLLQLYILQYKHFITTYTTQLKELEDKLDELLQKELLNNNTTQYELNPNAKEYNPSVEENHEEYFLPRDLLEFK